jgi:thymidine phosphorylase
VGNALEVKEAISILRGLGEEGPLKAVSLLLAAHMIYTGAGCTTIDEGKAMAKDALESGRGLDKLAEMIRVQGGDARVVDDISLLPQAKHIMPVTADMEGYIASIDTEMVGTVASILGAGRTRKDQKIDPAVGLVLKKRLGDKVKKGEELALFHLNDRDRFDQAQDLFKRAIRIGAKASGPCPLVYGTVTREGEKHFS